MTYNFLVLALLFLIPGIIIVLTRPDLRLVVAPMSLASIPFAFTESLFYPTYWEPRFLFDLADRIGFGIEDILFVVGLAAFTSTAYAFFWRRRYVALRTPDAPRGPLRRGASLLGVTFVLVGITALLSIPMIYGAPLIMTAIVVFVGVMRPDLRLPALLGGLASMVVYTGLCLAFAALIPGIFELAWHTEHFLDIYLFGIPVEELIYGFASGMAATAFFPYVFHRKLVPIQPQQEP